MINNKRRFFLRYISIIQKLRTNPVSFSEIVLYLKRLSKDSGENLAISKRTFQRDLNDIRDIFDINIKVNNSNKYFISDDGDSTRKYRMLETFDQLDLLYKVKTPSKYIYYENRLQSGSQHFHEILHAIHNRYLISFKHEKYWAESITHRTIEPIGIKESHHRWYLIARERNEKKIKTFGLDRISELQIEREKFNYPNDFDADEVFRNSFGVITSPGNPEEIVLSFDSDQRKFLGSLKIHDSQEVIIDNQNEYRIKLKLHITIDLLREILSYGESVEVIAPKSLRSEVRKQIKNTLKYYS